jgi:hypothetical protein
LCGERAARIERTLAVALPNALTPTERGEQKGTT